MDPQTARTRLTTMLGELGESERTLRGEHAGDDSELSHYDQHPADLGSNLSDQDREEAAIEVVQAQRRAVEAALDRLDGGSYGRCVRCGRELSDERLEARPEAARCLDCQEETEAAAR